MLLRSSVAVLRETRLELLLHSSEPEQLFRTSSHTKQHLENVMSYHFFGWVIWAMPKIDLFHSDFSYVYKWYVLCMYVCMYYVYKWYAPSLERQTILEPN